MREYQLEGMPAEALYGILSLLKEVGALRALTEDESALLVGVRRSILRLDSLTEERFGRRKRAAG